MNTLILCAILSGSIADDRAWTPLNTSLEATLLVLGTTDVLQTISFLNTEYPDMVHRESNPVLGPFPGRPRLWATFGVAMLAHAGIAYLLPHPYREIWQSVVIGFEAATLYDNTRVIGEFKLMF